MILGTQRGPQPGAGVRCSEWRLVWRPGRGVEWAIGSGLARVVSPPAHLPVWSALFPTHTSGDVVFVRKSALTHPSSLPKYLFNS